jgi:hypothetical protein
MKGAKVISSWRSYTDAQFVPIRLPRILHLLPSTLNSMPQLSSSNSIVCILDSVTLSLAIVSAASCSCHSWLLSVTGRFRVCPALSHALVWSAPFFDTITTCFLFQYYNTPVYLRFATAFLSTKNTENRCEMLLKRPFSLLDFGVAPMHRNT